MLINKHVRILEKHMSSLFPNLKINFYVSRRSKYIHMRLDFALFTLKDHDRIISEIKDFVFDELNERFNFCFPQLVPTVKWKYNYIVFKKRKDWLRYCEYFGWFFIIGISDMKYFLRKKSNKAEKVVFINETELKPKGYTVFGRCLIHGILYAYINFNNFQERFERLLPSDFFENINAWDMGNCRFPSSGKVSIKNNVVGDDRLISEGKITLFYSEKFTCYMLKFELGNFETY